MMRKRFDQIAKSTPGLFVLLVVVAGIVGLSSCGSDDTPADVPVVVPEIKSLSDSTLSPGDTLTVEGSGFATPASGNTVSFNNSLANVSPYSATATALHVVVPQNANSGPLHVVSKGVRSNSVVVEIQRDIGDVWVVSGGAIYEFTVPVSTGTEGYLIVAESATLTGASFTFQVTPDATLAVSAPQTAVASGREVADFATAFESNVRDEMLDYLRTHGPGKPGLVPSAPAGAPPQTEQFYVLKCTGCSSALPSSFALVTAELQYTGVHALIYADVNQPTGGFTQTDYQTFGARFDSQLYPTDTAAFGPPTDIDGNGKVIILFTPIVNDLTPDGQASVSGYIAGFFLVSDLAPNVFPPGTTNGAEIFYAMVPDPDGQYGNTFPKTQVYDVVPAVLAHEFEHMISIGYRYVVLGGGTNPAYIQQTWLEEGMAHMAEDLNGMDTQNIRRANLYLAEPYKHSLLGNHELRPNSIDTLQQRGGIFLFLRYLGDQLDEGIFKTMVRSQNVGLASVESITGVDFHTSVNDYLAALYLSDRGITSDPKYEYTSFNIQTQFANLSVTDRVAQDGAFSGTVRSATGHFFRVSGASPPALHIRVSSATDALVRVIVTRVN